MTAEELVARLRAKGVRVHRFTAPPRVYALTTDEKIVGALLKQGATVFGKYERNPGGHRTLGEPLVTEWDLRLNSVPVEGDIWEAAA